MLVIILEEFFNIITLILMYEFGKFLVIKYKHTLIVEVPDEDCEIL